MPRKKRPPLPGGQRLQWWIAQAARDTRREHGIHPGAVAALVDVNQRTIDRFELAESWPDDLDRYIAAYARAAGIDDAREIYELALQRWREQGAPLTLDEHQPQSGPARYTAAGGAAQARQRARRADREKPTPSRKKRASG